MKNIYYLPLEELEQRYSGMMNSAMSKFIDKSFHIVPNIEMPKTIQNGQFLDISSTIKFKAAQLQMVADMFAEGTIKNGDIFLVADMFFPGIESIKYMSELLGIQVYLAGFNYAGRADKNDFVRKLGKWADASEQGYHEVFDIVFVGSDYHKDQVRAYFRLPKTKVAMTGYIWDRDWIADMVGVSSSKPYNYVIWPHRPCLEKGVDEFLSYAYENERRRIVVTSSGKPDTGFAASLPKNVRYEHGLTKKEYYGWMDLSRFYLSTAKQETFGYTLQEAIHFRCHIAVPNRACYAQMVPGKNLYETIFEINNTYSPVDDFYTERWNNNAQVIMRILENLK